MNRPRSQDQDRGHATSFPLLPRKELHDIETFIDSSGIASLCDNDSRVHSESLPWTAAKPKPQFPMVTAVALYQPPVGQYGSQ